MSSKIRDGWIGLGLMIGLAGCAGSQREAPAPEPRAENPAQEVPSAQSEAEPGEKTPDETQPAGKKAEGVPPTPPPDAPLDEVMRVHFKDAELIRTAVIAGRPEDSGRPAESLLHLFEGKDLPKTWVEPVKRLELSTRGVKDSSDLAGVAAATADIGTSCGWCHQSVGGPTTAPGDPPADDGSLTSRMKRHVWATERLWEGLYVPSNTAWEAGARVLGNAPFPPEVLQKGGLYAKGAAADFAKISKRAAAQKTPAERAALYAELLGTCGVCHLAMQ